MLNSSTDERLVRLSYRESDDKQKMSSWYIYGLVVSASLGALFSGYD